jgi:hypothetical protein
MNYVWCDEWCMPSEPFIYVRLICGTIICLCVVRTYLSMCDAMDVW